MKQAQVQLLARKDLDFDRWDEAVRRAPYGLSWWLDAVTGQQWSGLVLDDYRAVMPLPLSRSIGPLKLINGAPFTQHQGPFGAYTFSELQQMSRAIPALFYVRKLCLYPPFPEGAKMKGFKCSQRTNHELSLQASYKELVRGYRGNLRRKLRDFPATRLVEFPLPDFLHFYGEHVGAKYKLDGKNATILRELTANIINHNAGNCYHLTDEEGQTIAAICLVRHHNRLFNLLAASSPSGFKLHGMTRLLDGVIRAHAGTDAILDFEGSDIPGVALFFRGFGAERVTYWQLGR